jgi:hypothetical protein
MRACVFILIFLIMFTAGAGGCAQHKTAPASEAFVRGQARVVEVDNALGSVLLQMGKNKIRAYWSTETSRPQAGSVVTPDKVRGPVGVYGEAEVAEQEFPGKVGDVVSFVGMRTGNELLLRRVEVISH